MSWTKALALLAAASVLMAPAPGMANGAALAMTMQDYAAREAQAAELGDFTGGYHGVVLAVFLIFFVFCCIDIFTVEVHPSHHRHGHGPVHP